MTILFVIWAAGCGRTELGGPRGGNSAGGAGGEGGGSSGQGGGCVVEVAGGGGHTCARKTDGTLWCWGINEDGRLGDGTESLPKPNPVQVVALGASVLEVAAGWKHTCARKTDGTLWCWGLNDHSQLGDGTESSPKPNPVQVPALGASAVEVAAGSWHTCARKTDGTLWCWGYNDGGQIGDGTTTNRPNPVQVKALGASVVEVTAGIGHTCARRMGGTLWCWGYNQGGQVGDGTTTNRPNPVQVRALGTSVVEVEAGNGHTCARKMDGTLWCWGDNHYGQIGDGTESSQKPNPVQVRALGASVVEVAAGVWHTCARKKDGTLWCWGYNSDGQVGDGTYAALTPNPVQVIALGTSVVEVAAGSWHTCARKTDGTLWCWGNNDGGQVGDSTSAGVTCNHASACQLSPVAVALTCP